MTQRERIELLKGTLDLLILRTLLLRSPYARRRWSGVGACDPGADGETGQRGAALQEPTTAKWPGTH